jgi:hypothetical protein
VPENEKPNVSLFTSLAANTATIATSIVQSPGHNSIVQLVPLFQSGREKEAIKPVPLSSFYKKLVIGILVIAGVCLLIEVTLGFTWPTHRRPDAFDRADRGRCGTIPAGVGT